MPKLSEFNVHMMQHVTKVIGAAGESLRESTSFGADYMRQYIEGDSPTGSAWHQMKNELNGFKSGSRIGGQVFGQSGRMVFQPSGHSGQMLNSITIGQLKASATKMSMNYGWLKKTEPYFLLQDTGGYIKTAAGRGKTGIGMGLLNTAADGGGRGTLQKLGAYHSTNNFFIKSMKEKGFTVTGSMTND